jgi:hypothetical protein
MELQEMLDVHPRDYLKNGFLTKQGAVREGINGYFSLAMAYRLREEGVKPEMVQNVLEEIILIAGLKNPAQAILEIQKSKDLIRSEPLRSLILAAAPWIGQSMQWDAFLDHLRRIMAQLALITTLAFAHESP